MKDVLDLFGDLPDYPGKRAPKNRPTSGNPIKDTAEDRYNGAKGKEYVINGEKHMFYSIGEVCKALGKSPVTLRMWESKGWIPKPSFRTPPPNGQQVPGKAVKGRRLYSQSQLDTLLDAVEQFGVANYATGDWDGFKQYIKEHWTR